MLEERLTECITGSTFRSLSATPAHAPRKAQCASIAVKHHRLQPPGECEWDLPYHTIRIALQAGPLERRINRGSFQRHVVQAGDLLLSPAYAHEWLRTQQEADFLNVYLDPARISQVAQTCGRTHSCEIHLPEDVIQDQLILQIGLALDTGIENADGYFSLVYVESLANALAAHLLKRFSDRKPPGLAVPDHLSPVCLRQVVDYIHAHLHRPLTLAELAGIAGLSPHHFARVFKRTMGTPPHQYVLQTRIEHVKTLLCKQDVPLAMIASGMGFVDQSHLTRVFKRLVGLTPSAFLQQQSKNIP